MQEAVSTRVPEKLQAEIEKLAELDRIDRSAEMRRLLEIGILERKKRIVIEKYRQGVITTEKAAEELEISIWEMLELFKKEKVEAQYDEEDFIRDIQVMKSHH